MKLQDSTLAVIQAATASANASTSERRALVQHNTANWVDALLHEWTCSPVEPARNSRESTVNPEETSAVLADYRKQVAELEKKLASVREEDVNQDVGTRTEELVSTSLDAQHEMNLLRDDLTRRVRTFEQTQHSNLKDLQTDYNSLIKALEQELPKKLDEIRLRTSHPQLVYQRKSLSHRARELRESLDEDFARQRSNLNARDNKDENGTNGRYSRPATTNPTMVNGEYKPSRGDDSSPTCAHLYLSGNESSEDERFTSPFPGTQGVLPPVIVPLRISPRMIAEGGPKIIKWNRRMIGKNPFSPSSEVQRYIKHRKLKVHIKPGDDYGRRIIFHGKGDMLDDGRAADVHFVLTRLDAPATKGREVILEDIKAPRTERLNAKEGATAHSGTYHYDRPPNGYIPYDSSPPPLPNGNDYVYYAPQYETTPIMKHERKISYSTAKQGGYYSPPGYPSPGFYETHPGFGEAPTQEAKALETKKKESQDKMKFRTTSGGQEALGQQKKDTQKGQSARSSGRGPYLPIRRDTEPPEWKKAEQLKKLEEQLYWKRVRDETEESDRKKAEELKKREKELEWIRWQTTIAACM